jgi:transposase
MQAIVHAADIQDRDGGAMLMATLFGLYPFLLKLYADGGYQGRGFRNAMKTIMTQVDVEIVKRSDQAKAFTVLPKRWVVERTFAWLNRCRRLAKDRGMPEPKSTHLPAARICAPHAAEAC